MVLQMKQNKLTYFSIAAVFVLSLLLLLWSPSGKLIQILASIPVVGSLVAALFQILRDQAVHDRQLLLLDAQNRFSLGATSHMASVAFDKHVQFCEEYVAEAQRTLGTLFREGPTEDVLKHTGNLYSLQQKYALWLTPKIEEDLELFESALRKIGANAHYVKIAPQAEDHGQRIAEMYKTFADVMGSKLMGSEWHGEKLTEELAISMVIRRLRGILGIEELTAIRTALVDQAQNATKSAG